MYRSRIPEDADFATMSYTYDAEGKLTQRSEGTDSDAFTYGFGSQLKQIQKTRAGTVTQTLSYAYDGAGKRVKVTDSGGTRYFLYDGGMPLLELDVTKTIAASYLFGIGIVLLTDDDSGTEDTQSSSTKPSGTESTSIEDELTELFNDRTPKASELIDFAELQGMKSMKFLNS